MVSKRSYVLIVKEKGESKNLSSRFSLFDSGAVRYLFHLRLKYPRIIMLSARLLNQINKSSRRNLRLTLLLSLSANNFS